VAPIVIVAGLAMTGTTTLAHDAGALAQEQAERAHPARANYSPYAGRTYPMRPLFGDTHLHTSFSMDAGAFGARIGPRDAYRFARGLAEPTDQALEDFLRRHPESFRPPPVLSFRHVFLDRGKLGEPRAWEEAT